MTDRSELGRGADVANALEFRLGLAWRGVTRFCRQQPLGAASTVVIVIVVVAAVFAPQIATYDPIEPNGADRLNAPGWEHPFGTDDLGRDIYSRIVWGARPSLQVGIVAVTLSVTLGTLIGLVTGYFGGIVDMTIQRVMDSMMAFPPLVLALTLIVVFERNLFTLFVALGIVLTPGISRVVRATVLATKANDYVQAARVIGARDARIIVRHVLPNIMAPIIVLATVGLGGAILVEASLSYLGLGVPPPEPTWGGMLASQGTGGGASQGGARVYFQVAPWMALVPGIAITVVVLAFNLLGDSLRDLLDPRLRGSR